MTTIKTICLLTGYEGTVANSALAVVAEAGAEMQASTSRPAGGQASAGMLTPGQRAWVYDGESRSWWPVQVAGALPDNAPTGAHVRGRNGGPSRGQSCPLSTEARMLTLKEKSDVLSDLLRDANRSGKTAAMYQALIDILGNAIRGLEEVVEAGDTDHEAGQLALAMAASVGAVRAAAAHERDRWSEWQHGANSAALDIAAEIDAELGEPEGLSEVA